MELNEKDIKRIAIVAKTNPAVQAALSKLVSVWQIVDSEYIATKSELDAIIEDIQETKLKQRSLSKRHYELTDKLYEFLDRSEDDDEADEEDCEKQDGDY